ncbi:uncharacterized protein LOC119674593 [Teleopsis dalmanni]|uniref:uncharacterized protein LOC119674586 n=1 Tax=Teleopsis dalmanni TaxID=139649 RepID=UPI0018CEF525|nr:uncharacterized protein LOC119674586 [Teleopsis dalmanni]XP_037941666.1 uncharacterized protein LOC119674593 [Teleopsis dalmanni]
MKVLQANIHRSKVADALLAQIVIERRIDLVLISEQYRKKESGTWIDDNTTSAAIWVPTGSKTQVTNSGKGNGYVYAKCNGVTVMSCYLTPSDDMQTFQNKLEAIEDKILQLDGSFIVGGDFNSRAIKWGMGTTNSRGRRVLEMAARLDLIVANTSTTPTFRREGCQGTIPDITLTSERIASKLNQWRVLEDYTGSDHQYLSYCIQTETISGNDRSTRGTHKWKVAKLKTRSLLEAIDAALPTHIANAEEGVRHTMTRITQACAIAMPKITQKKGKKGAYWWTEEISQLRKACLLTRRRYTRARRNGTSEAEGREYIQAKKNLKKAINTSKRRKWKELRNDINHDPWGLGYIVVSAQMVCYSI